MWCKVKRPRLLNDLRNEILSRALIFLPLPRDF